MKMRMYFAVFGLAVFSVSSSAQHEIAFSVGTVSFSPTNLPYNYNEYTASNRIYDLDGSTLFYLGWDYYSSEVHSVAEIDGGLGAEWSMEYGYYLTPRVKPFLRYGRSSKNFSVNRSIECYDFDLTVQDEYAFSVSYGQFGTGVAYELPGGLSFSLSAVRPTRNSRSAEVSSDYYYPIYYGDYDVFSESATFEDDYTNRVGWVSELGIRYRVGSFALDIRRLGPISVSNLFYYIPERYSGDYSGYTISSASSMSIMFTYSKLILN